MNLQANFKGIVDAIIVFAAYLNAATRWPVPSQALLIALLVIAASVLLAYLRTAWTEIIIDIARITCQGRSAP